MPSTPIDPVCDHCGYAKSKHYARGSRALVCPGIPLEADDFLRRTDDVPSEGTAPHPLIPLGLYRHYKGEQYVVYGGVLLISGGADQVLVTYRSKEGGPCFVRSVGDFLSFIEQPSHWRGTDRLNKSERFALIESFEAEDKDESGTYDQ